MIALPSFLAASDKPQAKPVSREAEAAESTENLGNDGFAALIAQLIQIVPAANGQDAEASLPADGETGNPAGGKNLPVDGTGFAATAGQAAEEASASASPMPVTAALMGSSATILSLQQAQASLSAKQGEPVAQAATDPELPQAPAKEGIAAQPVLRPDQIRVTVAVASAEPAIGALRADGAVAGSLPTEMKQAGREPQVAATTAPERTQSARTASFENEASSGERSGQSPAAENSLSAARAPASSEGAKPFAMPVLAGLEAAAVNRNEGVRMAAAAPTNAITSVETIERLVERLSVAREFDITKSASIAVSHREFGALTVTFDNARNGLDVEIAAKDSDMQRALAQAVAADRPNSRAGEPLQQSFQQQASQATSTGSERGAGSTGQGANSAGAGTEGERSQNQRDRTLPSSQPEPRKPAAPSPGDDALYA